MKIRPPLPLRFIRWPFRLAPVSQRWEKKFSSALLPPHFECAEDTKRCIALFFNAAKIYLSFSTRKRALFLVLARKERSERNIEEKKLFIIRIVSWRNFIFISRFSGAIVQLPTPYPDLHSSVAQKLFAVWSDLCGGRRLAARKVREKGGEKITSFVFSAHGKTPTEVSIEVELLCVGEIQDGKSLSFFSANFPRPRFFLLILAIWTLSPVGWELPLGIFCNGAKSCEFSAIKWRRLASSWVKAANFSG